MNTSTLYRTANSAFVPTKISFISRRESPLIPFENNPVVYFQKIDNLLNDKNGDYDAEFLIPSLSAIAKMKSLIKSLHQVFGEKLSAIKFIPNGKGGIEAMIRNKEKLLHLVVPADKYKSPYLFQKEGFDYGIKQFSELEELENWFSWVLSK